MPQLLDKQRGRRRDRVRELSLGASLPRTERRRRRPGHFNRRGLSTPRIPTLGPRRLEPSRYAIAAVRSLPGQSARTSRDIGMAEGWRKNAWADLISSETGRVGETELVGGPGAPTGADEGRRKFARVARRLLEECDRDELAELAEAIVSTLQIASDTAQANHPLAADLQDVPLPAVERMKLTTAGLFRRFEFRRHQLEDALSAAEAAARLQTSSADVEQQARQGTLLALPSSSGSLRFPVWQFSETTEGGLLPGLANVLPLLVELSPVARASWLVSPKPALSGQAPVELLRAGTVGPVLSLAASVAARRG